MTELSEYRTVPTWSDDCSSVSQQREWHLHMPENNSGEARPKQLKTYHGTPYKYLRCVCGQNVERLKCIDVCNVCIDESEPYCTFPSCNMEKSCLEFGRHRHCKHRCRYFKDSDYKSVSLCDSCAHCECLQEPCFTSTVEIDHIQGKEDFWKCERCWYSDDDAHCQHKCRYYKNINESGSQHQPSSSGSQHQPSSPQSSSQPSAPQSSSQPSSSESSSQPSLCDTCRKSEVHWWVCGICPHDEDNHCCHECPKWTEYSSNICGKCQNVPNASWKCVRCPTSLGHCSHKCPEWKNYDLCQDCCGHHVEYEGHFLVRCNQTLKQWKSKLIQKCCIRNNPSNTQNDQIQQ